MDTGISIWFCLMTDKIIGNFDIEEHRRNCSSCYQHLHVCTVCKLLGQTVNEDTSDIYMCKICKNTVHFGCIYMFNDEETVVCKNCK